MPKHKLPPIVRMEPVFARDAQRRLRLVIELLEQEAIRQQRVAVPVQAEAPRVFTAAQTNPGGTK